MNQPDLVRLWSKAWNRIIFAQLAPTTLLITTVALLQFGLADAAVSVRWAAELILLASGILGALAEFTAADEAMGLAKELATVAPTDASTIRIAAAARYLPVVKFVTPAVFVAIFAFLSVALLG
jgi:hypothetical protein